MGHATLWDMSDALNVLVVEDDTDPREMLRHAIESWGHECRTACDGAEALEMHEREPADVIISDWQMPRMDGLELCKRTRVSEGDHYTYFIFMTGLTDKEHFLLGMQAGADDYQTKPIDLDELRARLVSARRVVSVHRKLADKNAELRKDSQVSFRLARRDTVTTIGNRLSLDESLKAIWANAVRYRRRYSIILCDIDWFKAYNDRFGHLAGDRTLRTVAETLRDQLRLGDGIYRYGGEEFLVVLPEQGVAEALAVAERLRGAVERRAIQTAVGSGVVTISAGVAELDMALDETAESWVSRADAALYRAKANGRNRSEAAADSALRGVS
jgi:two-component system cell cycle response regulator